MESIEANKCESCDLPYNMHERTIITLPCGDQICLSCLDKLLQPQESKITCPLCQEIIEITNKFTQNLAKLRGQGNTLNIYCKEHPQVLADHYCKQHETLICLNCAFAGHADH